MGLQKQQSSITIYHLAMNENKGLFSFAENIRKLLFSVSSIFCLRNPEWSHGYEDMEI
jgi:hypothetical protein